MVKDFCELRLTDGAALWDCRIFKRISKLPAIRFNQARCCLKSAQGIEAFFSGNGMASIFRDDASVFTLSMHGEKNFPFCKEMSDLDVGLPDGCGDADYLQALEQALLGLGSRFKPSLVIYLAGADPFEGDRLGRLKLSYDGLQARDRRVFDWAWQRRVPLAMAGGYGHRIEETVQVQINTWRVAVEYWRRWQQSR